MPSMVTEIVNKTTFTRHSGFRSVFTAIPRSVCTGLQCYTHADSSGLSTDVDAHQDCWRHDPDNFVDKDFVCLRVIMWPRSIHNEVDDDSDSGLQVQMRTRTHAHTHTRTCMHTHWHALITSLQQFLFSCSPRWGCLSKRTTSTCVCVCGYATIQDIICNQSHCHIHTYTA